jgi:hypothetical protein
MWGLLSPQRRRVFNRICVGLEEKRGRFSVLLAKKNTAPEAAKIRAWA